MEFTLKAIQDAHSKYTGPDFPKLFKAFKDMGMTTNIVNIQQGTSTYINTEKQTITTNGVKATHDVATSSHSSSVKDILKRHQNGDIDFPTFCEEMAQAGIYKWYIDINAGTCSYIDLNEQTIVSEQIPQ
ncbi:DUF1398 domain-containing protein [Staphylococcus pasteuri]|uniref:DUF1398 domain-containing protein n=1 Tax=Staphylococcus pasteuri TaxID=45972 RepID=UPI000623DFE6|nr:DUF1398 family protein [Staphylococcus pasteuri]ATH63327.1 hypothetical protein BJG87_10205 [Staphylococcus pasteuri]KKI56712.1 hypothetical protein UF70_0355 [Staphylococcus pasteuri]MCF7600456.1 DUF1398 family protein [Staphylococcus pasteuri]MDI3232788.1 DUF1398 family protein [Staphylococcus pasteuri]MEB6207993.1 DUF1398 family protein [Staphylococcus pasteuri]